MNFDREINEKRFETEDAAMEYAKDNDYNIHSITQMPSYHLLRYTVKQMVPFVVLIENNRTGKTIYFTEVNKSNRTHVFGGAKLFRTEQEAISFIGEGKGWYPYKVEIFV